MDRKELNYRSVNPNESINREHLKFLDQRIFSNYNGKPAGFTDPEPRIFT